MVDTIFLSLAYTRIATMEKTPDASTPLDIKIEGNKADLVSEPQTFPTRNTRVGYARYHPLLSLRGPHHRDWRYGQAGWRISFRSRRFCTK